MNTDGNNVYYRILDTEGNVLTWGTPRQFPVNWGGDVYPGMLSGSWKGQLAVSPIFRAPQT
jgi:hypothetical protein